MYKILRFHDILRNFALLELTKINQKKKKALTNTNKTSRNFVVDKDKVYSIFDYTKIN